MSAPPADGSPRVTPTPSDEEVVAIMAAHEALWPQPVAPNLDEGPRVSPWRFSGRWWSRPIPARRNRPWR